VIRTGQSHCGSGRHVPCHCGCNAVTHHNSIRKEIKGRLKFGNVCYLSVQNLLSSTLLSKNAKIMIYRTVMLPAVSYGCENWSC
jgi:hypothetical protein